MLVHTVVSSSLIILVCKSPIVCMSLTDSGSRVEHYGVVVSVPTLILISSLSVEYQILKSLTRLLTKKSTSNMVEHGCITCFSTI